MVRRTTQALALLLLCGAVAAAEAPETVTLTTADGGRVTADLYDGGGDGVVLVHGAAFDRASWAPLARTLRARGLRVFAIDLRGRGTSTAGSRGEAGRFEDVLAAVRELRRRGVSRVSVVGASMGGAVAADAAVAARPGEVSRLVLLSPASLAEPERLGVSSVFILSDGEPMAQRIREDFRRAPEPKHLIVLPGAAHAQHVFATAEGGHLTQVLVDVLVEIAAKRS
jgi:pimeloyl-ACP methyl ester carboxylesterase